MTGQGFEPKDKIQLVPGSIIRVGKNPPIEIRDPLADLESGEIPKLASLTEISNPLDISTSLEFLTDISVIGGPKTVVIDVGSGKTESLLGGPASHSKAFQLTLDGTTFSLSIPAYFSSPIFQVYGDMLIPWQQGQKITEGMTLLAGRMIFTIPVLTDLQRKIMAMGSQARRFSSGEDPFIKALQQAMSSGQSSLELGARHIPRIKNEFLQDPHTRVAWDGKKKNYVVSNMGTDVGTYYRLGSEGENPYFHQVPSEGISLKAGDWVLIGGFLFQLPEIMSQQAQRSREIVQYTKGTREWACEILGLDPRWKYFERAITAARRKLVLKYHPDTEFGSDDAMKDINNAVGILSPPPKQKKR